jgi:hypothetical protein
MRQAWISAAVMGFMAASAIAQDGPKGIAFVLAPEQGAGMCFGGTPEKAFDCAKKECVASGAPASECLRVQWCYPSGWSADIFVQNQEGLHWHEYLCGWDSRETLEAAAAVKCDKSLREYLLECTTVQIWDDTGEKISLEGGQ